MSNYCSSFMHTILILWKNCGLTWTRECFLNWNIILLQVCIFKCQLHYLYSVCCIKLIATLKCCIILCLNIVLLFFDSCPQTGKCCSEVLSGKCCCQWKVWQGDRIFCQIYTWTDWTARMERVVQWVTIIILEHVNFFSSRNVGC